MGEHESRVGSTGKRLFVAVDVDEPTREARGQVSSDLRVQLPAGVNVSWVTPDRMHLTLRFFGDADAADEDRIRSTLARPILQAPFDLSFEGLGLFPPSGPPRVLWMGIRDGLAELRRIHRAVWLSPDATDRQEPPFTPHLTLCRVRSRLPRRKLSEIANIPAMAGPCRIDRVTLYESRLSPAGSTYIRLAEALLTP